MSDRMLWLFILSLLLFSVIDGCRIRILQDRVAELETAKDQAR